MRTWTFKLDYCPFVFQKKEASEYENIENESYKEMSMENPILKSSKQLNM